MVSVLNLEQFINAQKKLTPKRFLDGLYQTAFELNHAIMPGVRFDKKPKCLVPSFGLESMITRLMVVGRRPSKQ